MAAATMRLKIHIRDAEAAHPVSGMCSAGAQRGAIPDTVEWLLIPVKLDRLRPLRV